MASPGDTGCPLTAAALRSPGKVALRCEGRSWTYAELDLLAAKLAAALRHGGVAPRDRVALLSHNRPELLPLFFAIGRVGAVAVLLNARLTQAELAPQLETAKVAILLSEADGSLQSLLASAETSAPDPTASVLPSDAVRVLLFTSGTTGRAKAAALTWENFVAAAAASAKNIGGESSDAWLLCLPIFHVGGLTLLTRCVLYGCTVVLHPRFDPAQLSRSLDEDEITHASLVTVQLQRLLEARGDRRFHPRLRAILIGGGPVPFDLLQRARALGAPVLQTYGLTEACAQVTTERPAEADGTTAGPPLPGSEVRIVGPDGGELPAGEVGEIEVRGPTVFAGYFGDEAETHQTLWKGWLRTRDLGALDERGRLRVFSRRTDLIISGGENVYPAEIEAVLLATAGVREAAVLGVADPRWGQVPVAVISGTADEASLVRACEARLARFKQPRRFLFVPELPRNATGKVDRLRLRALVQA